MFDIKKETKNAFLNNKIAIYISIAILLISLFLGYLLAPYLFNYFNPLVEDLTNKVQSGVIRLTFKDIFFNNFQIVFFMFIFGIVFCFSIFILLFNGFFVGYYVGTSENLATVLLLIIPHGIFEFSSCILACASGITLFNFLYKFVKSFFCQNSSFIDRINLSFNESYDKLKEAVIIFAIASLLMIIAGFIEVYLTLPFAQLILSIFG